MMKTVTNLKDLIEGDRSKIPIPLVRLAQKRALHQIKKISKGVVKKNENPKKIIFNRVYATYDKTLYQVIGIAKALQLMGHDVKFLLCGGRFKNCTTVFSIQQEESKNICQNCVLFGSEILEVCDIPFDTYENILSLKYRNSKFPLEIESYVSNSIIRYFKGCNNFLEHPDFNKVKEDRECNAVDSLNAAKIIYKKEKPDIIYTSSCTYTECGPFAQYMRGKGVRCIVWGYTYGEDVIFDIGKISDMFTKYKKKHPFLTKREREHLHKHMEERKRGDIVDTQVYGFNPNRGIVTERKYDSTYAMFPNVPWDSSLVNANKIFDSVYDWIDTTINYFKSNQNNFLYIKIHPAEESIDNSYATVADYINKHFSLTDNIRIINDKRISPYVLGKNVDSCIMYNGTTGVEMSILGIPSIIVGNIYYTGKGFTYEPNTVAEYCKWLDSPPPKLDDEQVKKAEEFGYYYLVKNRVTMDYVSHNNLGSSFVFKNFSDILNNKNVRASVDYILNDVSIVEVRNE